MISGHLQEKNGRYYMVLNLKNENQKWKPKWIATGLPAKGNKKKAETMLRETIRKYENMEAQSQGNAENPLFSDYMLNWLELIRNSVEATTFTSYRRIVKYSVAPYFKELDVNLCELQPKHIQGYYNYLMVERKNSATTVRRHHANIRKALQQAVKTDLIPSNPADKVEKPKQQPYIASFYNDENLNLLFEKAHGTRLELPIIVSAFYGLRRSEVLGLKWSAIDFKNKTITINHTVAEVEDDEGKKHIVQKDRTKNKSSYRTLPLIPQVEEALLWKKIQDDEYRKVCRRSYCKDYTGYVFVDELGRLLKPEYLTKGFQNLLNKHELRLIRFHDLRHSCASLLLKNGVSMKAIQEWLGHSHFSTTANFYAHLDYDSKRESANAIGGILLIAGQDKATTITPSEQSVA
jgi:integrase